MKKIIEDVQKLPTDYRQTRGVTIQMDSSKKQPTITATTSNRIVIAKTITTTLPVIQLQHIKFN